MIEAANTIRTAAEAAAQRLNRLATDIRNAEYTVEVCHQRLADSSTRLAELHNQLDEERAQQVLDGFLENDDEEQYEYQGCECEVDWNCPLHRDRLYTACELQADAWASQDEDRYGF